MSFQKTDKLIILSYPPGAGGKFVSNCLALSPDVLPMGPNRTGLPVYLRLILNRVIRETKSSGKSQVSQHELDGLLIQLTARSSGKFNIHTRDSRLTILRFFRRYHDVKCRLEWVMKTLPDPNAPFDKPWPYYELDSPSTFGFSMKNLDQRAPGCFESEYFRELYDSGLYFFSVMHRQEDYEKLKIHFPECRQIRLVNTRE